MTTALAGQERFDVRRRGALASMLRAFAANKTSLVGLFVFAIVVVGAIGASLFSTYDPLSQDIGHQLLAPSSEHWFGTDQYGRDVWSRVLFGARISLVIGIVATLVALIIGSAFGIVAGWYGAKVDAAIMQLMDALLAFPALILGLIIVAMLGASITNIIAAIAVTSIPPIARIARAPTLALKHREYIEAGRALGFSDRRIVFVHLLPNIFPEILVMGSLWLANAIRT